jgi:hypothetical protein
MYNENRIKKLQHNCFTHVLSFKLNNRTFYNYHTRFGLSIINLWVSALKSANEVLTGLFYFLLLSWLLFLKLVVKLMVVGIVIGGTFFGVLESLEIIDML